MHTSIAHTACWRCRDSASFAASERRRAGRARSPVASGTLGSRRRNATNGVVCIVFHRQGDKLQREIAQKPRQYHSRATHRQDLLAARRMRHGTRAEVALHQVWRTLKTLAPLRGLARPLIRAGQTRASFASLCFSIACRHDRVWSPAKRPAKQASPAGSRQSSVASPDLSRRGTRSSRRPLSKLFRRRRALAGLATCSRGRTGDLVTAARHTLIPR